ncbi:unnamed protein product [Closterium sp. NIES-65]|nr:unnamed protein product [Closterium sp. NIES-65]
MSFAVRLIIDRVFNAGKLGHSLGCFSICSVIPDHICFFSSGCVDQIQQMADKNHPNIVKLLGFAIGGDLRTRPEQVLIYEYVPNGDLHRWIGPSILPSESEVAAGHSHRLGTGLRIPPRLWHRATRHQACQRPHHQQHAGEDCRLWSAEDGGGHNCGHNAHHGHTGLCGSGLLHHVQGHCSQRCVQVAECLSKNDVGSLMDPTMDAPAEAVLRVAQISLACTGERTADRPSMVQVANELQAIREAVGGKEVLCAAVKVDAQVQEMKDVVAGVASLDMEIMKIGEQASG